MKAKIKTTGKKILLLSWEASLLAIITVTAIYILAMTLGKDVNL